MRRSGPVSYCSEACILEALRHKPSSPPLKLLNEGGPASRRNTRFNREKKVVHTRDGSCRRCGVRHGEAHHIAYRSEGGPDHRYNLIKLCRRCHEQVHSDKKRFQPLCRGYIWCYYVLGRKLTLGEVAGMVGL